jgi:hypothetical protein
MPPAAQPESSLPAPARPPLTASRCRPVRPLHLALRGTWFSSALLFYAFLLKTLRSATPCSRARAVATFRR